MSHGISISHDGRGRIACALVRLPVSGKLLVNSCFVGDIHYLIGWWGARW